jgi:hypothetical protein
VIGGNQRAHACRSHACDAGRRAAASKRRAPARALVRHSLKLSSAHACLSTPSLAAESQLVTCVVTSGSMSEASARDSSRNGSCSGVLHFSGRAAFGRSARVNRGPGRTDIHAFADPVRFVFCTCDEPGYRGHSSAFWWVFLNRSTAPNNSTVSSSSSAPYDSSSGRLDFTEQRRPATGRAKTLYAAAA